MNSFNSNASFASFLFVLFLPVYLASVSVIIYHAALLYLFFPSVLFFVKKNVSYFSNSSFLFPLFSRPEKNYQSYEHNHCHPLSKRHFFCKRIHNNWSYPYKFGSLDISTNQSKLLILTKWEKTNVSLI